MYCKNKVRSELATLLMIHDYYALIHRQTQKNKYTVLLVDIIYTSDIMNLANFIKTSRSSPENQS